MRKIEDYQIIRTADHVQMAAQVRAGILHGWQPLGGVCSDDRHLVQAMVKYEAPPQIYSVGYRSPMDREYHIIVPDPAPTPVEPTPSDAPGWPAPGVYGDRVHIEREPTVFYCAASDCPGSTGEYPCGLVRCMMPAGGE